MRDKPINKNKIFSYDSKIILFVITLVFHILLIFHTKIISLFYESEIGGAFIAIVLFALFILLFFSLQKPFLITNNFDFFRKIESSDLQKSINLYLLFTVPISIIAIGARFQVIQLIPMDSKIADMLPLIENAGRMFLEGFHPYQTYYVPHSLPLTFWPGLWMSYLPAIIFDFDLRFIGLFIWIIISTILVFYPIKVSKNQSSTIILIISAINILFLQFSFQFIAFQAYGHTFPLWLWLILLGISLIEKRWGMSAILLGLVLSSRQTAIIIIPILFACWYHQVGWKISIRNLIISGLVFGLFTIPFFLRAPEQFIKIPIQHYQDLGEYYVSLGMGGKAIDTIGFSYLIQKFFGGGILTVITGIIIFITSILSFIATKNITDVLIFIAFCIVLFSFFTPIPWMYEYFPAILILTLANFS